MTLEKVAEQLRGLYWATLPEIECSKVFMRAYEPKRSQDG